jgi:hypothetical protein
MVAVLSYLKESNIDFYNHMPVFLSPALQQKGSTCLAKHKPEAEEIKFTSAFQKLSASRKDFKGKKQNI